MRRWKDPAWRAEFHSGARELLPVAPGILAWGLVTGVAMVKSGLSVPLALLMSLIVYAGSAQLAALPLIAASAPAWIIAVTALATNMRFVIYGAATRRWLTRSGAAAVVARVYQRGLLVRPVHEPPGEGGRIRAPRRVAVWRLRCQLADLAGGFDCRHRGQCIMPTNWGLQFAGTLALLPLVMPSVRSWAGAERVPPAACRWPPTRGPCAKSGLLAGVVVGITVATVVDSFTNSVGAQARP